MESTVLNLTFCKVEPEDREALIALIANVLRGGDSLNSDKYNLEKWLWKYYSMPHSAPQIFICKEGESILGYYHCPVYQGTINGVKKKFAMVQDVGMSESARGKGVFRKLADYATEQLIKSDVNMIYTFPNKKSIHTFLKYNGYSKIETFSTFVLPIKTEAIIASKIRFLNIHKLVGVITDAVLGLRLPAANSAYKFEIAAKLNEEIISLFLHYNAQFKNSLTRDYDYLHWRYELKPHGKHYFFTAKKEGKVVAAVILTVEDLLGTKAAVVLDFACIDTVDFSQLIGHIRKNAVLFFKESIGLFYTSVSNSNNLLFQKSGFLKIPERLNPRALHLLGKNITEEEQQVLNSDNWNFTLSEWDVL